MSAFARCWGQADINSASSDRLGLLGIPVHPANLIRLAGATFVAAEDDAALVAMA